SAPTALPDNVFAAWLDAAGRRGRPAGDVSATHPTPAGGAASPSAGGTGSGGTTSGSSGTASSGHTAPDALSQAARLPSSPTVPRRPITSFKGLPASNLFTPPAPRGTSAGHGG